MSKFTAADVLELPVPERLQLVEDIWNTIADAPDGLELTEEDKRLIDERLEAVVRIPERFAFAGSFGTHTRPPRNAANKLASAEIRDHQLILVRFQFRSAAKRGISTRNCQ